MNVITIHASFYTKINFNQCIGANLRKKITIYLLRVHKKEKIE